MYDHLGLKVKDLDASVRFYEAVLAPLGHVLDSRYEGGAGLGPRDAAALWLYEAAQATGGTHVALQAPDRAAVDAFHAAGVSAAWRLARELGLGRGLAGMAAVLVLTTSWLVWSALSGMEVPLFVFLSLRGILLHLRERRSPEAPPLSTT